MLAVALEKGWQIRPRYCKLEVNRMPEGQGKKGTCDRCGDENFVSPWWETEEKMIWLCQRCQNYVLLQQQAQKATT
jgi:hypothetical protein